MKVSEMVLKKQLQCLVDIDSMQFGFMPGRGTSEQCIIYFKKGARRV